MAKHLETMVLQLNFLKRLASEISEPLTTIYNKSLLEGDVPHEWKQANVTSLFKKGSKSEHGSYRPVSLTSYLGKILEAILECGPMPNVMVTLPNIAGALCSTPQSLADAHC